MHNDSLDSLLLRHYGEGAATPPLLEQRLLASVRRERVRMRQQAYQSARIQTYRLARRRAVKLVALSSAGLGALGAGLEVLETSLLGGDTSQTVFP